MCVRVYVRVHSCVRRRTRLHSSTVCRCIRSRVVHLCFVRTVSLAQLVTYGFGIKHCCRMPRYMRPKASMSRMYQRTVIISHPSTCLHPSTVCRCSSSTVVHRCFVRSVSLTYGYGIQHCVRMPRYRRPMPSMSRIGQRTVIRSHPSVIANARHGKQKWISVVHVRTFASMSLVLQRAVSVAPPQ